MTAAALTVGLCAALAAAMPCAAETVAIVNARLETAARAGVVASGAVVIADGKILAVGPGVAPPPEARVIDAHGGVVAPGFISPSSNLMVNEVNLIAQTRDDNSGDHLSAGFDPRYGVNPASALVPVARLTGVTRAVITPILGHAVPFETDDAEAAAVEGGGEGTGGGKDPALFAGQAVIVRLDANDTRPVIRAGAAVAVDLGEAGVDHAGSRGSAMVLVRSALADARRYGADPASWERAPQSFGLPQLDLQALVPVVRGATPLLVRVHRASDIREALTLAKDEHLKIILDGAEEAWMVAPEIARAGVPVLLDPEADLPEAFESLGARLDNAARLQAAGVLIALKGSQNFNALRPLRLNAGEAVAYGLPRDAAMAAITVNPARIWGMADRTGSLEVGKDADLVVWTGDPLETASYPVAIFIGGVEQPMTSRRLELRDRYLKPDDGYPPAYH